MTHDTPEKGNAFDPPVRMTDDGRLIHISIGLDGILEEQIRIDLEDTTCTLSVSCRGVQRKKSIEVPQGTRLFRKTFSFGVLDLCLEKPIS